MIAIPTTYSALASGFCLREKSSHLSDHYGMVFFAAVACFGEADCDNERLFTSQARAVKKTGRDPLSAKLFFNGELPSKKAFQHSFVVIKLPANIYFNRVVAS